MKRILKYCTMAFILALTFVLSACTTQPNPPEEPVTATVIIELPEGVGYDGYKKTQTVEVGDKITLPADNGLTGIPEGKEVDGWYVESDKLTNREITVTEDITVKLQLKTVMVTVTVNLPVGVSYDGYEKTRRYEYNSTVSLPADSELTGIAETMEVDGWYIGNVKVGGSVTVKTDTVIELRLKEKEGTGDIEEPVDWTLEYGDTRKIGDGATVEDGKVASVTGGILSAVGVGTTKVTNGKQIINLTVKPARVDVVLFTGQSNMVGRETEKYTVDIAAGQAYEFRYNVESEGSIGTAPELKPGLTEVKNPVGENMSWAEHSSGSSIVPQFCADYVENTGRKIVAVHVARGGRPINNFVQGGAGYNDIVIKYGACIDYLEDDANFEIAKKFYVMVQGESDTASTTKEQYKERYMSFHSGLVSEFGIDFGAMTQTGRDMATSEAGIVRIAQSKIELAYENADIILLDNAPATYWARHKEYMRSDNVHYNGAGLKKIASDSCYALINYLGYGEEGKAGVDPVKYIDEVNPLATLKFGGASETVQTGKTLALKYTATGAGYTFAAGDNFQPINMVLEWSSSNPAVATVDKNGTVTAVSEGKTTVSVRSLRHLSVSASIDITVSDEVIPVEPVIDTYRWDFNGNINEKNGKLTATKAGSGEPVFEDGRYTYGGKDVASYYTLSENITLAADKYWSVEWRGYSAQDMGRGASILLAGQNNTFVTYNPGNGIYVCGSMKAQFKDTAVKEVMYTDHMWKLQYSPETNKIELFIDGVSYGTLGWSVDIVFDKLLGRAENDSGYGGHFTGSIDYLEIVISDEAPQVPVEPVANGYRWDFNGDATEKNGKLTATKAGSGEPVFEDGRYTYSGKDVASYYTLSENITLAADKDWTVEWKGYSAQDMGRGASVVITGNNNQFITYNASNGIYVRSGSAMAKFNSAIVKEALYTDHIWKLQYSAETNQIELFIDDVSVQTLDWNANLVFDKLLGKPENADIYGGHFTGSIDYLEIRISN